MAAAEAGATVTPDRIDFINEDDAGSVLLALLEQVTNPACAHPHEHLHEIGTGDGEERYVRFAGHSPRQQCFARSRRSYEQHAFRNASTQLLELLRLAQELDDLPQLFLGLIHACHVLERDFLLLHG